MICFCLAFVQQTLQPPAECLLVSYNMFNQGYTADTMPLVLMLPHVHLCGHLQDILPELYCGHDAFLFSSRYEAWGMPVLEAMAAGLAVVATACLGVDTFARHGMNALLAAPQVGSFL